MVCSGGRLDTPGDRCDAGDERGGSELLAKNQPPSLWPAAFPTDVLCTEGREGRLGTKPLHSAKQLKCCLTDTAPLSEVAGKNSGTDRTMDDRQAGRHAIHNL